VFRRLPRIAQTAPANRKCVMLFAMNVSMGVRIPVQTPILIESYAPLLTPCLPTSLFAYATRFVSRCMPTMDARILDRLQDVQRGRHCIFFGEMGGKMVLPLPLLSLLLLVIFLSPILCSYPFLPLRPLLSYITTDPQTPPVFYLRLAIISLLESTVAT